jgi:hypothetical protein
MYVRGVSDAAERWLDRHFRSVILVHTVLSMAIYTALLWMLPT